MEYLHNGFTLELCDGAFPLSTDSIALAHFVKLPNNARVLDLGSGCGTLGLMLCATDQSCQVTGIELDPRAHETALKNIEANALDTRLYSLCGDLTQITAHAEPGGYQVCVSNPPYFHGGKQSQSVPLARHDSTLSTRQLMEAAARSLRWGGDFFLVHRPESLAQLISEACAAGLEPKRLRLLRHRADGPISLILIQCRKGAKPGLRWEEAVLREPDGSPTAYYRAIYHL